MEQSPHRASPFPGRYFRGYILNESFVTALGGGYFQGVIDIYIYIYMNINVKNKDTCI
jgi:hypothetical protein